MQRREALARVTYREGFHSGLWLERFPPDGIDGRLTDIETESFVGEACRFQMPEDYTPFYEAWKGELAATGAIGRVYRFAKGSRLLVGLGAASLLENSVALHPVGAVSSRGWPPAERVVILERSGSQADGRTMCSSARRAVPATASSLTHSRFPSLGDSFARSD